MAKKEAEKLIKENESLKKEIEELRSKAINESSDPSKPVFFLTIGEFSSLLESILLKRTEPIEAKPEKYVYGIEGIRQLFHCSRTTAGRILASGKIDQAVTRVRNKIQVDVDKAMKLAEKK